MHVPFLVSLILPSSSEVDNPFRSHPIRCCARARPLRCKPQMTRFTRGLMNRETWYLPVPVFPAIPAQIRWWWPTPRLLSRWRVCMMVAPVPTRPKLKSTYLWNLAFSRPMKPAPEMMVWFKSQFSRDQEFTLLTGTISVPMPLFGPDYRPEITASPFLIWLMAARAQKFLKSPLTRNPSQMPDPMTWVANTHIVFKPNLISVWGRGAVPKMSFLTTLQILWPISPCHQRVFSTWSGRKTRVTTVWVAIRWKSVFSVRQKLKIPSFSVWVTMRYTPSLSMPHRAFPMDMR